LEHGAVWVTYTDELPQDQQQKIAEKVNNTPYTFMSPFPDQPSPLTLTAWSVQLRLESADDPRVDEFIDASRQSERAPEPGGSCQVRG
jgi:hypothetical protein